MLTMAVPCWAEILGPSWPGFNVGTINSGAPAGKLGAVLNHPMLPAAGTRHSQRELIEWHDDI